MRKLKKRILKGSPKSVFEHKFKHKDGYNYFVAWIPLQMSDGAFMVTLDRLEIEYRKLREEIQAGGTTRRKHGLLCQKNKEIEKRNKFIKMKAKEAVKMRFKKKNEIYGYINNFLKVMQGKKNDKEVWRPLSHETLRKII